MEGSQKITRGFWEERSSKGEGKRRRRRLKEQCLTEERRRRSASDVNLRKNKSGERVKGGGTEKSKKKQRGIRA